ncbi:olfactory receptor 5J3-like [Pelobates fuscus]|uniref:olfactory receptor 5J3-like n=1 Tax=Pelobates fuscus TaxID=191477 RepID=UPI002FE4E45B
MDLIPEGNKNGGSIWQLDSSAHCKQRSQRLTLASVIASQGQNRTRITEFLLLAFGKRQYFNALLFVLFLVFYLISLLGNILVISLVVMNQSLHCPMYFFLSQMSVSEILFTSSIVPNMLHLVLAGGGNVSVSRCIIQFCLLGVPTIAQCFILAVMSFDRYVAICNPFHYTQIMTFNLQVRASIGCWMLGFLLSLIIYFFLHELEFCDSNIIDHYYCDIAPVLKLSCSDTRPVELLTSLLSAPLVLSPLLFIIVTYTSILLTILKIPTISGRQKAFSTCSSHLSIVCMYYGTLATIYIFKPKDSSLDVNKTLSLLYTLVTPLLNPIVYSLRNQDIRKAAEKSIQVRRKQINI